MLRFNTRGTASPRVVRGRTEAASTSADVEAAVATAASVGLPHPWLLGWSFGTDLALRWGCLEPVRGAVLFSPPLRSATSGLRPLGGVRAPAARACARARRLPEPPEARERFAGVPQARVVGVLGARHLWVGEPYVRRVLDEIVTAVAPAAAPLPDTWDGPYPDSGTTSPGGLT